MVCSGSLTSHSCLMSIVSEVKPLHSCVPVTAGIAPGRRRHCLRREPRTEIVNKVDHFQGIAMCGRMFLALAAITALCFPERLWAQFTDPRTYTVSPVGVNQLETDFGYARADASIDNSLVIGGAHLKLQQATVSYSHNFSLLGDLAWLKASAPLARLSGYVAGTRISGSTSGAGDASLELATLIKGGQALSAAEFSKYESATTCGMGVTVTAPTGEYNSNKLLNLGAHRWSIKPEVGISQPFGAERTWVIDGYVNTYFFSDNTSYRGTEVLRQEPLPGLEAHISH